MFLTGDVGSLALVERASSGGLGSDGREGVEETTGGGASVSTPAAAGGLGTSQARHFVLLAELTTKHDEHFH